MTKDEVTKLEHEAGAGAAGAAVGAILGSVAGPPGAVVGAILGAAVGAISDAVAEEDSDSKDAVDAALDREIGVTKGDLGAPNLEHPPAKTGAYSGGASGAPSAGGSSAEGPIPVPS